MRENFLFIQRLVDVLSGVEVHLVPNTQEDMLQLVSILFRDILPTPLAEQAVLRRFRTIEPNCIYMLSSALDLQYAVYCHSQTGQILVIGPSRAGIYTEKEASAYLRRYGLSEPRLQSLLSFCKQQPLVPYDRLYSLAQLLAQQLADSTEPLPCQRLDHHWNESDPQPILVEDSTEELEHLRRVEIRYAASAALTEAVKQGNLSLAYRFIQKMNSVPDDLMRNPNSLRNSQNLCIILNTQLRHAMEEVGVPPYRLDQISGGIARQIEKLKTSTAVNAYFAEILRQYCDLSQEKAQRNLSPFARTAVTYIKSHLTDNLTVKEAAKALLMNPDYLSARFHQEVGIPFITYVNQERIHQAAALLRRTDMQVQQIASHVGYNNASYFARQFVKFMGVTPRAYRGAGE